jgi:hypothetical protein
VALDDGINNPTAPANSKTPITIAAVLEKFILAKKSVISNKLKILQTPLKMNKAAAM